MKEKLSPEAEARVQHALNQTDWYAILDLNERRTKYRAAKEKITADVLADLARAKARRAAEQSREAQAEQARYGQGNRHGH